MLANDDSRCEGESSVRVCDKRADCERHHALLNPPELPADAWIPAVAWLCHSDRNESWIPRPCAGKKTRLSSRPHPLCRDCRRFWYGISGGIKPDWVDRDGIASCWDRVVHRATNVGGAQQSCAPTR